MNSNLERELELKHLVTASESKQVLEKAMSKHRIDQYYFRSELVQFQVDANTCEIALNGIALKFLSDSKKRRTLVAILDQTPDPTVRLRRMENQWFFTIKGLSMDEGTLEFEVLLSDASGLELLPNAFQSLEKTRYIIYDGAYMWEMDIYAGKLEGLVVAELEDKSYDVFPPTVLPKWVGPDVTNDFRYKNSYLASSSEEKIQQLLAENRSNDLDNNCS